MWPTGRLWSRGNCPSRLGQLIVICPLITSTQPFFLSLTPARSSPARPNPTQAFLPCALQDIYELKDQIQDVEGRYMQGLKELKVEGLELAACLLLSTWEQRGLTNTPTPQATPPSSLPPTHTFLHPVP